MLHLLLAATLLVPASFGFLTGNVGDLLANARPVGLPAFRHGLVDEAEASA